MDDDDEEAPMEMGDMDMMGDGDMGDIMDDIDGQMDEDVPLEDDMGGMDMSTVMTGEDEMGEDEMGEESFQSAGGQWPQVGGLL